MSTYRIHNQTFPWPEEGETNWSPLVTDFVFALANAINDLFNQAIFKDEDSLINGAKTFTTPPRVTITNEDDGLQESFYLVYSKNKDKLEDLLFNIQDQFIIFQTILGANQANTLLDETISKELLRHSEDPTKNIKNYLTSLFKQMNLHTPLGTILPSAKILDLHEIAKWIPTQQNDPNAIYILDDMISSSQKNPYKQTIIEGTEQGFYKLSAGPWALCDGKFPLPLSFGDLGESTFGNLSFLLHKSTPNLLDEVYLQGSRDSFEHVIGSNNHVLTPEHLPPHTHSVTGDAQTNNSGEHSHKITDQEPRIAKSFIGAAGSDNHGLQNRNLFDIERTTELSGDHNHNVSIDLISGSTGSATPFSINPRHVNVKYYIRVF